MKPRGFTVFLRNVALVGLLAFCAWAPFPAFGGDYRLPDTGQTKCYDDSGNEIACPKPDQSFYGQDGNYKGPQPSFKGNGDGTVSDLNTTLMWQQADTQNSSDRTWQDAVDYCEALTLAGYSDWRLPSVTELQSILDLGRYNPTIDTGYFSGCKASYYWSGTSYAHNTGDAWYVRFNDGPTYAGNKSYTGYVRCVRGGL